MGSNLLLADYQNNNKLSDEKIQKLKAILTAAKSNAQDLRSALTSKDSEILKLASSLEACTLERESLKSHLDHISKELVKCQLDLEDERSLGSHRLETLQNQLQKTEGDILEVKTEFQKYKARAHAALQKANLGDRVTGLEVLRAQLDKEKK